MVDSTWNTATHPVDEQLAYWADVVCQAFTPLAPTRAREHITRSSQSPVGVYGWVRSARLAETNSAEIASCTQLLRHGPRQVRESPSEEVFVNLQMTGSCKGEQDGRRTLITPGQVGIFDTTRPYALEFEESSNGDPWRVISFRIPRSKLLAVLPPRVTPGGQVVDGRRGAGMVATSMMRSMWESHSHLTPASRLALDDSFIPVLVTALGAFDTTLEGKDDRDAALRAAIVRFVSGHLRYGRILADDAADHVGISVRKLHQIFAARDESFGNVVRDMRLESVARELRANGALRSITDLAHEWGFSDGSHLIRLFKQRFACTPGEYRDRFPLASR